MQNHEKYYEILINNIKDTRFTFSAFPNRRRFIRQMRRSVPLSILLRWEKAKQRAEVSCKKQTYEALDRTDCSSGAAKDHQALIRTAGRMLADSLYQ